MNIQDILTVAFYAITIGFLLGVIYREMTNTVAVTRLQISTGLQEQDLYSNTLSEEQTTASEEISHEPIILPPVVEEKSIEIAELKVLTLIKKKELDFPNMNVIELREECSQMRIKWREAVTDIKTGKKRSLRKAEMVAALQQKLSA